MRTFKGIIALDIDGTITVSKYSLEKEVENYFNYLISENWQLIFITGRTFSFSKPLLSLLKGKYFLAVQNGAALYEMPLESCLKKKYLSVNILTKLDTFFQDQKSGLLVESGKANADICYYKPHNFSAEELEYIAFRIKISPEQWVTVPAFNKLSLQEFAVGKYFASKENALELAEKILKSLFVKVTVIRDPFRPGFYLGHVNALQASKGTILDDFKALYPSYLPVIAAGDDYNDIEMLEKSMIKIVMQNGPEEVQQMADILAAPVENQGIIKGLEEAIWKVSSE